MPTTYTKNLANRTGLTTKIYKYTGTDIADSATALYTIDYANITNIEIKGDRVWSTGGSDHTKQVPFDNPLEGSFKLSSQHVPLELLAMLTEEEETIDAAGTGHVTFKDGNQQHTFYVLIADTIRQDETGAVINETLTAYKCLPRVEYSNQYSGDGDPQSVDITFDCLRDAAKKVLDIKYAAPATT